MSGWGGVVFDPRYEPNAVNSELQSSPVPVADSWHISYPEPLDPAEWCRIVDRLQPCEDVFGIQPVLPKKYKVVSLLKSTRHVAVYKVRERKTGKEFACKLKKYNPQKPRDKDVREVRYLQLLDKSPGIVQFAKVIDLPKKGIKQTIIQLCECSADELGEMNISQAQSLLRKVAECVKILHDKNILHRDLKLQNILVNFDKQYLLCDFDCSATIPEGETMVKSFPRTGTHPYLAPEAIWGDYYKGTDVWNLGLMVCVALVGKISSQEIDTDYPALVASHALGRLPKALPEEARELLHSMLDMDVHKRPTIEQVLRHPWVAQTVDPDPEALNILEEKIENSVANNKRASEEIGLLEGLPKRRKS